MAWKAVGSRSNLVVLAFVLPLCLWSAVSYIPALWHPLIEITAPGDSEYLESGMRMPARDFRAAVKAARAAHKPPPTGFPANPVYLPAPHEVARALWVALTAVPLQRDLPTLPWSFWHSILIIAWGFLISSAIGVPLGILCGTSALIGRLVEPFVDFVRYMPAPAFGALAVAILGIYDGPKVAIIVIGTLFQQILIIANTTRQADRLLIEAALTLGAKRLSLLGYVIVPAVLPQLYRDQRILLGWAWTYLIVAEMIGTSSGITFFITQQARYQHFASMYGAILLIGIAGSVTDIVLARLGRRLFPWDAGR
ncbi:MAG: ABC transporter permease [Janthinobacterium lividum]